MYSKLKHLYIVGRPCYCFSVHPSLPFTGTAAVYVLVAVRPPIPRPRHERGRVPYGRVDPDRGNWPVASCVVVVVVWSFR